MQGDNENKLSEITIGLMVATAFLFDLAQLLISLISGTVAEIANWLLSIVFFGVLYLWFKIHSISFTSPKRLLSMGGGFLIEVIPYLDLLPGWTVAVALTIFFSRVPAGQMLLGGMAGSPKGAFRGGMREVGADAKEYAKAKSIDNKRKLMRSRMGKGADEGAKRAPDARDGYASYKKSPRPEPRSAKAAQGEGGTRYGYQPGEMAFASYKKQDAPAHGMRSYMSGDAQGRQASAATAAAQAPARSDAGADEIDVARRDVERLERMARFNPGVERTPEYREAHEHLEELRRRYGR